MEVQVQIALEQSLTKNLCGAHDVQCRDATPGYSWTAIYITIQGKDEPTAILTACKTVLYGAEVLYR